MKVFVTGGSGFLGRGILSYIRQRSLQHEITIYSRDEWKQFEVKRRFPEVRCILGDIKDFERLRAAMLGHDLVIHAGAVKFIPEAEQNVLETIAVNVEGSRNVAVAAVAADVPTVVGVSTDKACSPVNTYGATKLLMERMFAEANRWGSTRFVCVRYGNVIGSTGSVIPVFMQQLKDYNEIRLTDGRMTRFWLPINSAVQLVFDAAENAKYIAGSVLIDACPAMTIRDLALAVATAEGRQGNYDIVESGIRPGEKLHESLYSEQEFPRVYGSVYGPGRFKLDPATAAPRDKENKFTPSMKSYSSDEPLFWVKPADMAKHIIEAREIWL